MDKPLDVDRVCRTCLDEADNMTNIFNNIDSKQSCSLATMVADCSEMKVHENDGLPDKMCRKCVDSVRNAFVFRKQCNTSYQTLCKVVAEQFVTETTPKRSRGRPRKQRRPSTRSSTAAAAVAAEEREELLVQVDYLPEISPDVLTDQSEDNLTTVDCKTEIFESVEYLTDSFANVVKQIKNEPPVDIQDAFDEVSELNKDSTLKHACIHCERVFSRSTHLRRHLLTHTKERPFPCKFCPKLFARSDALAKHELTHSETTEVDGVKTSPSHEPETTLYFDAEFEDDFVVDDDNEEEIAELEPGAETSTDKTGESKDSPGKYPCEYCDKVFGRTTHLKRHILTHTKEKQYQCTVCSKAFARSDHLAKHESTSHSTERPFKCQLCEKAFKRAEHLRNHIESKHSDKEPSKKTEICDVCQKGFATPKSLENHRKGHFEQKVISCKYCELQFTDRVIYRQHLKQEHLQGKGFLCSECGQSFVRNDYLLVHMRRHNGIKPYKCKFCPKAFPRATDLNVHEKYHTNEKTHLCTICGKGFHRAYNLVVHSRTHNGLKPYKCPHCPKSFAQGNDLKAHIRRHTGERYKCDVCDMGFIQLYQLSNHRRSVHNIDPAKLGRRVTKYVTPSAQEQQVVLQQLVAQQQQLERELEQQQQGWSFEHMGRDPDLEKKILETKERIQEVEREVEELNSRLHDEQQEEVPGDQEAHYPHPSYGQQFLNDPSALAFADPVVKTEKPQGQ